MTSIKTRLLDGFDDPTFSPQEWDDLLRRGDSDVVFLTWHWQRSWWESFPRDDLLLVLAEESGRPIALAPLFNQDGVLHFVGSGGSDYLDFIGDTSSRDVLSALLETARSCVRGFKGFRFYHVLESSGLGERLQQTAGPLSLACSPEDGWPAPAINLTPGAEASSLPNKKSLRRHEGFFKREGSLEVYHLRDGEAILPHLDAFFAQHVSRWKATSSPSLFLQPRQRLFYERLTRSAARSGWLRFTRLEWNRMPIAFHFGFCYRGSYLWYKPSFAIDLARRSPGEVLLRQLLLAAMDEGAHTFDLGLGDEPFKRRFATHVRRVRTWGLYPSAERQLAASKKAGTA